MADIVRRSDAGLGMGDLDPFRLMREMMRLDPFRELAPMAGRGGRDTWMPSFEVRENGDVFRFIADVPGVKGADLDITISGNRLTITGKREAASEHKDDSVYAYERQFGSFTRMFTLPDNVDAEHVSCELTDGVLTVVVPKAAAARPRKIEVGKQAPRS